MDADFQADYKMVRALARRLVPKRLLDDAVSEGLIGLLEARRKGIAYKMVVRSRIIDFYRRETHGRMGARRPILISVPDL